METGKCIGEHGDNNRLSKEDSDCICNGVKVVTENSRILNEQRRLMIDVSYKARQGHLSSAMSTLEILNVLFHEIMTFDTTRPENFCNDRFILSKGHAALALYTTLYQLGCITKEQLYSYSKFDSILGEHPDRNKVPAVDVSTGSLGHGLPNAVGMAIGFKAQGLKNRVFCIIGDGEANEGTNWESAYVADKMNLNNLLCIVDDFIAPIIRIGFCSPYLVR